ncbi:hypothetical protein C8R44DRAFT_27304 [Mycena epipterygia]|nr:hypothetical protein C8R44DRAFT_27304 [Mycena epipterygia]
MSSNTNTSPLYQYVVLAAVAVFASVFATVFFRSRRERRRRVFHTAAVSDAEAAVALLPTPLLYDAYLGAPATKNEWDAMMPLSALGVAGDDNDNDNTRIPAKGSAVSGSPPRRDSGSGLAGVLVSVLVRMPLPELLPAVGGEDEALPYLEIGLSAVDVPHGG